MDSSQSLATDWGLTAEYSRQTAGPRPATLPPLSKEDQPSWVHSCYAGHRLGMHAIAKAINSVPPSESRLRDQGLIPFYEGACDLADDLRTLARQHNLTLAPCESLCHDYLQECEVDEKALIGAVAPYIVPQQKGMLDFLSKLATGHQQLHWTSMVAFVGVSSEFFIKQATAGEGVTAPDKPSDALLTPNAKMRAANKVIMEEVTRLRDQSPSSGWNEKEAQELTMGYLAMVPEVWNAE